MTTPSTTSSSAARHPVTGSAIIDVDAVSKTFPGARGTALTVLDQVNLTLHDGEIVALLGRSGSGKSTLLRIIAGLIAPSSGQVRYRGRPLTGANPGVGMVFQSFALMPWLSVLDNVELGLQARAVPPAERRERALAAIDAIGLDGFETAYLRELSGGMRQRVGFARALVLQPDTLLMDEPFSALDVLTAENLRTELVSLWARPDFPTKSVCIVTHNIDEAVLLADRVVVLGANPGRIKAEVPTHLPRPRDRRSPTFDTLVDQLYAILTGRDQTPAPEPKPAPGPLTHPLPAATVGGLAGLVEIVYAHNGKPTCPTSPTNCPSKSTTCYPWSTPPSCSDCSTSTAPHAVEHLRATGVPLAVIATGGDPGHKPARALYEQAGFRSFPQQRYYLPLDTLPGS